MLFGLALLLFCLNGIVATVAIINLLHAERWVMHTRDVQVSLAQVNIVFSRVGRSRAEYVISPDPARLSNYQAALSQIEPALTKVKALTADNPAQQRNYSQLAELSDRRIALIEQSVASTPSGQAIPESQSESVGGLSSQIDAVIQEMNQEEQRLLESRIERRTNAAQLSIASLVVTFVIAGALFVFHYRFLNQELVERQRSQAALQKLNGRILTLQDEERRKFSRELHDSMGQLLVGIKMNLDLLGLAQPDNASIKNCCDLLEQALRETRSISYLLHPPLLDQAGFASAAREYVEGFSKRSGISVHMTLSEEGVRLPAASELAMYRVLQESLTNILKHSNAERVTIDLGYEPSQVTLSIQDDGQGMPVRILEDFYSDGISLGVGLAGMRERIRELHGRLEIQSDSSGSRVTAVLPRPTDNLPTSSAGEVLASDPA